MSVDVSPSNTDSQPEGSSIEPLTSFTLLTEHEVRKLIVATPKKSCVLDPMPTPLLVACIDTLLPVITKIINLSLQNGIFADQWKCALVHPLLKKFGLEPIFQNFRPVSNLQYISKLPEKAVFIQTHGQMVTNNIYWSQGGAIDGSLSMEFSLDCCVPQGSCLGLLLFVIYTSSLFKIIERHLPQVHCYADDTQLYLSFRPGDDVAQDVAHRAMKACIKDIRKWMIDGQLLLNITKTEFLAIGTRQQLSKLRSSSIEVGNQKIDRSSSVRNLGVMLDESLRMNSYINQICNASFNPIHNIRRISNTYLRNVDNH